MVFGKIIDFESLILKNYVFFFRISQIFLDVTFLNLTPNRLEALDLPFYVDSSSVTLVADIFSAIISILLVMGFYMLQKGNLSPYRTDISIQVLAIILVFVFPQIATWLPRLIN